MLTLQLTALSLLSVPNYCLLLRQLNVCSKSHAKYYQIENKDGAIHIHMCMFLTYLTPVCLYVFFLFSMNPDPRMRQSFWISLVGPIIIGFSTAISNQSNVQRYCSIPTLRQAKM